MKWSAWGVVLGYVIVVALLVFTPISASISDPSARMSCAPIGLGVAAQDSDRGFWSASDAITSSDHADVDWDSVQQRAALSCHSASQGRLAFLVIVTGIAAVVFTRLGDVRIDRESIA
ncbi:hypothetical protein [Cellulomonas sp. NPDC089187]|uniref:hypothetical protein n=1 Tax=Cellulomonas sp. NPDC089187 TaxID=3154970 RepID=UPI00343D5A5C